MATLYLLKYNNYYNRIVRKEEPLYDEGNGTVLPALDQYLTKSIITETLDGGTVKTVFEPLKIENVNFIPNDYVNTTQVVNIDDAIIPDYVLVVNADNEIESRWFVVNTRKPTYNQLELTLHRDLVVDYNENVFDENSKFFVEKGIVDSTNNLIYNNENMDFNQIKKKEILLQDQSKCPWVCIYAARNQSGGVTKDYKFSVPVNSSGTIQVAEAWNEAEWNKFYNKAVNGWYNPKLTSFQTYTLENIWYNGRHDWVIGNTINWDPVSGLTQTGMTQNELWAAADAAGYGNNIAALCTNKVAGYGGWGSSEDKSMNHLGRWMGAALTSLTQFAKWLYENYATDWAKISSDAFDRLLTEEEYKQLMDVNNQVVSVRLGDRIEYRRIYVTPSSSTTGRMFFSESETVLQKYRGNGKDDAGYMGNYFYGIAPGTTGTIVNKNFGSMIFTFDSLSVSYTVIGVESTYVHIGAQRIICNDAPYDIFCLPYSDTLKVSVNGTTVTASKDLATQYASAFPVWFDSFVYDVQLLPYCPIPYTTIDVNSNTISFNGSDKYYTPITKEEEGEGDVVGFIFHVENSSFSRLLTLDEPITIQNTKIENETDIYRLCSPNYNGVFEFSAAKNKGVTAFNLQCTYKPYTPYIKLFPIWNGLYGSQFSDQGDNYDYRGLICGGDFSLPVLNDKWKEFEINNKNYQISFDRQIQNMEVNNAIQNTRDRWTAGANTLTSAIGGGISGASTGAKVGGGWGAAIGGVLGTAFGGITTGIAGQRDIQYNIMLQNEAIDYTKDQFGYQLGNIKALPQGLVKTTGYNVDNKYFPFLEYYTCTDEEKMALANKIAYNGMTVMTIGSLAEYIGGWSYNGVEAKNYIKGQLIRLEGFNDDYHILNAIADEINQGVFLK